jgi:hypothetical protein
MTSSTTKKAAPKKRRVRFGRAGGWSAETAARDSRRCDRVPLEQSAFMFADVPSANERWQPGGLN